MSKCINLVLHNIVIYCPPKASNPEYTAYSHMLPIRTQVLLNCMFSHWLVMPSMLHVTEIKSPMPL